MKMNKQKKEFPLTKIISTLGPASGKKSVVDEMGAWHRICTDGLLRRSNPMTIDRDHQPPLEY